jgi:outer membrane receptor protein involved in Fe transport
MKSIIIVRATLFAATAAVLTVTAAHAQTPAAEELGEVVVTGSRVIKNGNDSPTPVTVLNVEDMATVHPGNIADQLNDLPQFAGSRGQTTNPGGGSQGTSSAASNPSANTLNLRNMGYTRTLVLMNGHRLAPSGTDGTVDTNNVPNMLLERVDIVTGGASAVYGSDAVTGAVNFIINPRFNGLKVNGQVGISHYRDDRSLAVGVAGGMDVLAGRGHIEGSVESRDLKGVLHRSDRPFGRNKYTLQNPTGGSLGPYVLVAGARNSRSSFNGMIRTGPLANQEFTASGALTPFDFGNNIYGTQFHQGGSGSYDDTTLQTPLTQNQFYGRFDYDFSDNVHGYADVLGAYSHTWAQATFSNLTTVNGTPGNGVPLSSTNPYLSAAVRTTLSAAGANFNYSKGFLNNVPASNVDTWVRQHQESLGLNIKLGGGYVWDMSYSHAQAEQNTRQNANINKLKMAAAVNTAVNPANGQIVCAVSLTANASLYPGCVPMNPFGLNSESPESVAYVLGVTQFWAHTTLQDVNTSLTGAPFSTWAGPVDMALAAEWRKLSYYLDQDGLPNDPITNPVNCTGLLTNLCSTVGALAYTAQTWATQTSAPRSLVSQSVKEASLEFNAPLIKDVRLARDVSLNAAARWTNYSTSGKIWSWKAGLVWKLGDQLTIRGTRSKDIRAPTLNDLYVPASPATTNGPDYVTGVLNFAVPVPNIARGNPDLVPEVGNTSTAGFVYAPHWLPGFSLTLDAFEIDVSNALASFRGQSADVQLGCAASNGVSPFCTLVVRPINCCSTALANTATTMYTQSLNLASQWTTGIDMELNYSGRVRDRPFSLRTLTTWQPNIVWQSPGAPQYNTAGGAFNNGAIQATPVWRVVALARYSPFQNFTVDVMERWRSALNWGPTYAPPNNLLFTDPPIESVWYTNLNLSYAYKRGSGSQTDIYLNVTNLFNRQPPPAAFFGNQGPGNFGGFANGDDPIGSMFTLGFRYRL